MLVIKAIKLVADPAIDIDKIICARVGYSTNLLT